MPRRKIKIGDILQHSDGSVYIVTKLDHVGDPYVDTVVECGDRAMTVIFGRECKIIGTMERGTDVDN